MMKITTLAINVSAGRGNRAVVMDVFSFVDVLFIIDQPLNKDGGLVPHENGVFDLFSFCVGSGVEVYVRKAVVVLFEIVEHEVDGVAIAFWHDGVTIEDNTGNTCSR